MIPYLRLYDSSIYNYLKHEVLGLHYVERVEGDSLTFNSTTSAYDINFSAAPLPSTYGRGLILFDEFTVSGRKVADLSGEQTSQVSVVGPSAYDIDYLSGRILNANAAPTSVDYSWHYVSLIQGWPGEDPPPGPVVAIDIDSTEKSGFQLGGGTRDTISVSLFVFATSEGEKRDLTDLLYQSLYNRTLAIKNWHQGNYLDFNGTYTGFAPTTVSGISSGSFLDVEANLNGPRMNWSEVNKYRSRINFTFEVFKDD